jgi:hypothetical protein
MVTWRKTRKPRPNFRRPNVSRKIARVWTPEEITFLRKYYRNHETVWCARQLSRTVYSIRYKASNLNIRKGNPSTWVTPQRNEMVLGGRYNRMPSRRMSRTQKPVRWGRTRRNNRRTRW